MSEREDIIIVTLRKYDKPRWNLCRKIGRKWFAIDFGHYSIIVEIWFKRRK